jgi:hypothetical protein
MYTFKMKFIINFNLPGVRVGSVTESRIEHSGFSTLENVLYFLSTVFQCAVHFETVVWFGCIEHLFIYKKANSLL